MIEEYCGTCSGQGVLEKTKQVKVSKAKTRYTIVMLCFTQCLGELATSVDNYQAATELTEGKGV